MEVASLQKRSGVKKTVSIRVHSIFIPAVLTPD